jgi:hypothetical protein
VNPECWGKGGRHPSLEGITGELAQLALDGLERCPLPLPDLDREQLEKVTVVVRRGGTRSFGAIEQTI